MNKKKDSTKLDGKDLMNVGIFTALNVVIGVVIACTIGLIPIGFILIPIIGALILGIPMMLYFTRIKKFGMILIMYIVNGVVMVLTGMGFDALICGTILALVAELIIKSGKYQSASRSILAYAVTAVGGCASYIHWLNASSEWLNAKSASYGETYMQTIVGYFENWWMFPALIIATFISGLIGGCIGRAVLKKHFIKSGLV